MLDRPITTESLQRPKRERKLPNVLSRADLRRIFRAPGNAHHRLVLILIYSARLRVSEVVRLRVGDTDTNRRLIHVRLQGRPLDSEGVPPGAAPLLRHPSP
jgi:integrase